jgi:hypothetical protein
MYIRRTDFDVSLTLIEWLARIGSIASITLLIMLFQAEALHPSQVASKEWAALVFFPIGIVIGLMIAWWREGVGASLTLISLLAFYFVYGYLFRYHISGWAFVLFASPAFLFLFHWLLYREGHQK